MNYDLIILGGGPAGYFAAERAAEAGFNTVLFEERSLGGVCLNEGCIPTKSLLHSAKLYTNARHGEAYGVYADNIRLDHKVVVERKNNVTQKLVKGVAATLKQKQVNVVNATGTIKGKNENGFIVEVNGEEYTGSRLLICTGSEVAIPKISGIESALESGFLLTSREILDLETVPERLVIAGGGIIGLELADYFAMAGSDVTVVEMMPEVGGAIDSELASTLRTNLEGLGVKFLLNTKVVGFESGLLRCIRNDSNEIEESIYADKALLSIGRKPRTNGIGLETIGIYTEKGAIVTDSKMRTSLPMVWAAGDVNGKMMLAHTAYREAAVAINDIAGIADTMCYDAIPQIVYTSPEVACVGETEETATAKGYKYEKAKIPLMYSGRYVAESTKVDGFIKVLAEKKTRRILGVHIIGLYASEIILSAAVLVGSKRNVKSAAKIVYPHPTVGEVLRDALLELM